MESEAVTQLNSTEKRPNPGRHQAECQICRHEQREEIERAFVNWTSPASIAQTFGFKDKSTVYGHAHAFDCRHLDTWSAVLAKIHSRRQFLSFRSSIIASCSVCQYRSAMSGYPL
jgi:hypothetical protein